MHKRELHWLVAPVGSDDAAAMLALLALQGLTLEHPVTGAVTSVDDQRDDHAATRDEVASAIGRALGDGPDTRFVLWLIGGEERGLYTEVTRVNDDVRGWMFMLRFQPWPLRARVLFAVLGAAVATSEHLRALVLGREAYFEVDGVTLADLVGDGRGIDWDLVLVPDSRRPRRDTHRRKLDLRVGAELRPLLRELAASPPPADR